MDTRIYIMRSIENRRARRDARTVLLWLATLVICLSPLAWMF